jgi:hypothetical protein
MLNENFDGAFRACNGPLWWPIVSGNGEGAYTHFQSACSAIWNHGTAWVNDKRTLVEALEKFGQVTEILTRIRAIKTILGVIFAVTLLVGISCVFWKFHVVFCNCCCRFCSRTRKPKMTIISGQGTHLFVDEAVLSLANLETEPTVRLYPDHAIYTTEYSDLRPIGTIA